MTNSVPNAFTSFGELLKYLRRRARLTQSELGIAVGYSAGHVARLEAGQRLPDITIVKAQFIEALGLVREPELASRLIELADVTNAQPPQPPQRRHPTDVTTLHAPHNLPAQLTSFIGRGQEAAQVQQLLATTRLLTLTGSGGVGKTRLAIEVAAHCALESATHAEASALTYPDGVWLVELAPITDPALVADTVALALGLHAATRSAQAMLVDYLRDKTLLLLLDNCEHLIGACALLVEALLRTCTDLRVLATSREGLNIPGETRWRVPPLATDEAVQLFAAHARAAQPGFTLTEHNASLIARLCERLDGIPLAIELAAARLHVFSVEQIAARLDDRFRLLTGGSRTALSRHRTLRAMIDWSYDLLPEAERILLRQLAVFAGGWTLEAAEAVHGSADVLGLLAQLVSKSLVVADTNADNTTDRTRYWLLETIRQYAHDKLAQAEAGEYEAACLRHLAYFAGLARTACTHWFGPAPKPWFDRLETELDNLRAALDLIARNQDVDAGAQLIGWIYEFWFHGGHAVEGIRWINAILPPSAMMSDTTRLNRLMWLGALEITIDIAHARDRYAEAAALACRLGDERLIVTANHLLSWVTEDYAVAAKYLHDEIRLAQRDESMPADVDAVYLLDRRLHIAADPMFQLGTRMCIEGDYQGAVHWLTASAHDYGEQENSGYLAHSLGWLGMVALAQGDYVQARAQFETSSALCRQCGHTVGMAEWLSALSTVAVYQGDYVPVQAALKEAITIFYHTGNLYRVAHCLAIAAHLAQEYGQPERAAQLLGAAGAIWHDFPVEFLWRVRDLHSGYEQRLLAVRSALDPATFDAAWAEGLQMSIPQAIRVALAGK